MVSPSMAPLTRSMKKKAKNSKSQVRAAIQSLPNDLLIEVLAKVAASSFDDLYSAKLCCKDFNKMAEDGYIFEHVDIRKFSSTSWSASDKVSKFLERCKERGNAEALYRQGMHDLFTGKSVQLGLVRLKKAALKGHVEASYVYGVFLVCHGGEWKRQGLELLYSLDRRKSKGLSITECRERAKDFIWNMWVDKKVVARIVEMHYETTNVQTCSNCGDRQDVFTIDRGWDSDNHEKFSSCNSCNWHQEVNIFCDILSRSRSRGSRSRF